MAGPSSFRDGSTPPKWVPRESAAVAGNAGLAASEYPMKAPAMNEPAIDDLLSTSLYSWYSAVAQWMPGSYESTKACEACHWELNAVIDPEAWPHELVDGLAGVLDEVVRHVAESIHEEEGGDAEIAATLAESVVMARFVQHRSDIIDVLEQCIPYRLEAYLELELDLAQLG